MAFDQSTRNRLQKFVSESRSILTEEFTRQLQAIYGMDPKNGSVAEMASLSFLDNQGRQTAKILRETLEHFKASLTIKSEKERNKQGIERIIREQSFTVLNRLGALRMAEARGFLLESVAKGYSSKGFQLYKNLAGSALGETGAAYQQYLFSIFDEFSQDLAVLFDRNSSQGLLFPRESALLSLLDQINHFEIENLWVEDETIGWIYQYFNSQEERKKMRAESQAPRNSRELAVRNQFFTPRYVVEFLTDNTLGRIWYEMTQGKTALVENCRYLVRRPNEIFLAEGELAPENDSEKQENLSQEESLKQPVYIPFRKIKDPRELRMLDPACGSMHFGLYAFDLFEEIYKEAWQMEIELGPELFSRSKGMDPLQVTYPSFDEFRKAIPSLIIECNIHGVDIDPRAVQIAGLSLWQRAQRSWHQMGIKPNQRPTIKKSNIVCAESMPGEKEMLLEFTGNLNPPILGQLVETIFDKMELAGEAGSLLKIEEEIFSAISNAKNEFNKELLRRKEEEGYFPGMAPKREASLFDFAELTDETGFWDTAEDRILEALQAYADQAETGDGRKRLFAEDAAKGFAFIDLCRKRFDVVLMNPPFGEFTKKTKTFSKSLYPNSSNDILGSFVERGNQLSTLNGRTGAITSRTSFFIVSFKNWRINFLHKDVMMPIFADLGLGIMDDAMVESACYVIQNSQGIMDTTFIRLLQEKVNKEQLLYDAISAFENGNTLDYVFLRNIKTFQRIDQSPFAYWIGENEILSLSQLPKASPELYEVKQGLATADDPRFARTLWEVPSSLIRTKNNMEGSWVPYIKGGGSQAWYSPLTLVVNWRENAGELWANLNAAGGVRSNIWMLNDAINNYFFKPGISWTRRAVRFIPYVTPDGALPSASRYIAYPRKGREYFSLVLMASNIVSAYLRSFGERFAHPNYMVETVKTIPVPNIDDTLLKSLESLIVNKVNEIRAAFRFVEPYQDFVAPKMFFGITDVSVFFDKANLLGEEIDRKFANYFGFTSDQYDAITLDLCQALTDQGIDIEENQDDEEEFTSGTDIDEIISYFMGVVFGRWDISKALRPIEDLCDDPFKEIPRLPSGALCDSNGRPATPGSIPENYPIQVAWSGVMSFNIESGSCLSSSYEQFNDLTKGVPEVSKILSTLNKDDLQQYLEKPQAFFKYHLLQYTKSRRQAPIYWPLQTTSSSYTLWVYYHRLTEQTLYTCINDFLEGPKGKLSEVTDALNALRNKNARSTAEEKELVRLTDFETELKDFRDELLRLAKFWKPNLNDGVQITAAPLWKLFQHKQWQKKLKETWDNLEKGEYDWAHMAFNIWPERVLRKCHEDRSLAIAHDVENDFWEEVEIPVIRRGKDTGETKVEWQPKKLNEDELKGIITQKIAELR